LATTPVRVFTAGISEAVDFESLVIRHQSMVYSIALHFLRNPAVAEEVAQEVFLELYLHRDDMQSPEHVTYWLRKVTSRRCIDQSRRGKHQPKVGLDDAPEPFSWMPVEDPLLKQYIGQLVGTLQEMPRMIVILRYQEDLGPGEIAELLDMPVATVKSHLQRALTLLRRKVAATTGDEIR
jgi:RNA polymerase sigma-70 factor (ECF subfamily)